MSEASLTQNVGDAPKNTANTLAVAILTNNEEKNIVACVESASFADEIIVVDSGSDDSTVALARKLGAKVFEHKMTADGFAGQRNFALTKATAHWILYLDADERILPETAQEIAAAIKNDPPFAYRVKRINIVFGQRMYHGGHKPDYVLRLFPRDNVKWNGVVHESATTSLPIKSLHHPLTHFTYTNWERYFEKFNSYTSLMAERMAQEGKHVTFAHIIFRPLYAFFRFYILQLGFLDGKQGFIFAANHFFYTMIKYVKRYYRQEGLER